MNSEVWRCGPPRSAGRKQGFPARFWDKFKDEYVPNLDQLLHLCSGAQTDGYTVDIDISSPADAHWDCLSLPAGWADKWDIVFCDPPYNAGFATEWPAEYPRPSHLLREMYRVCKPGGVIAMLHILVLPAPQGLGKHMKREAIHAILAGPHNAIRALNIFHKEIT